MPETPDDATLSEDVIAEIAAAVSGIKYGSVEIVIHDGRIVQIVRTEKVRVDPRSSK